MAFADVGEGVGVLAQEVLACCRTQLSCPDQPANFCSEDAGCYMNAMYER
jgi:hypothetical protein